MKFARYLEENVVVEWRKAYINYRGLKKLIKRVDARHKARLSRDLARQTSRSSSKKAISATLHGLRRRMSIKDMGREENGEFNDLSYLTPGRRRPSYGGMGTGAGLAPSDEEDKLPKVTVDGTGLALTSYDHPARDSEESDNTKFSSGEVGGGPVHASKDNSPTDPEAAGFPSPTHPSDQSEPLSPRFKSQASTKPHKVNGKADKKLKKKTSKALNLDTILKENFDDQEKTFFSALDNELERIVSFYEARESDMAKRYEMLARQLQELAEHRREYKASHLETDNWTEFGHRLSQIVPSQLVQPAQALKRASLNLSRSPAIPSPSLNTNKKLEETTEETSHKAQIDEGDRRRLAALTRMFNVTGGTLSEAEDEEIRRLNKDAALSHDPERYKTARKKLKAAVLEYYRGLEILKNYKILNRTGFAKILKKFEKTLGVSCADAYYSAKVSPSILVSSESVEKLIKGTEEIYTAYFEHGNRKRALERLRINASGGVAAEHTSTHHLSVARAGFYLGITFCAFIGGLIEALRDDTPVNIPQWDSLLRVYGAEFIPTLFALLFGLNLAVWHRSRVNTVFIFEWDVRHALDYHQYFELPAFFLLLLSLAFWVSFLNPFPAAIAPTTWPLVWLVVVLAILLNPLPFTIYHSRKWIILSLARVMQGGVLYGVEFRDFFLGDELNSVNWPISMLWFFGCQYNTHWAVPNQCDPNKTWWTAVLLALPAFLRFLQCFRRYKDSKYTAGLHLINAGKYSSSIFNYFFYFNYRYHSSSRTKDLALWCVFGCIYSVYTSTWDITMDWSLLRRHARYPWLRNELVFEAYWPFYYWAIITNIILRFGWVIYLIPGPASNLTRIFVIAFLEMLRRFQWNFLRLENEHLGNVDMYRVSREIPLPYHFKPSRATDEDEDEDIVKGPAFGPKALLQLRTAVGRGARFGRSDKKGAADQDHPVDQANGMEERAAERNLHSIENTSTDDKGKQRDASADEEDEGSRPASWTGRLARRFVDHLVPDAGGPVVAGSGRLDDIGAARGAHARDYQPRQHEAEADDKSGVESSEDEDERPEFRNRDA